MPAWNTSFDDLATTTLKLRSKKLADNATLTVALLDRLRRKGNVRPADGGTSIVEELETGLNTNGGWFSGYDTLNTVPFEPFSAAEYNYKQAYVPVIWSGEERRKNNSESQTIDLIAKRIDNGEKSLYDLVAQASYSDGTSYGGKQLGGLALAVIASPTTGTVGGISRVDFTGWRNKTGTVAMATAVNLTSANPSAMTQAMNSLAISCTRGKDRPDLIVTDSIGYQRYLESNQGIQRITGTDEAGIGFTSLKYYGAGNSMDVVLDNGYCPTKTMYMLNTDFLFLRPHPDLNFAPMGDQRTPVNQDAIVKFLGFMGNMTYSRLAAQGILTSTN